MIKDLMHAIFNEDVDVEEDETELAPEEVSESEATYTEPTIQVPVQEPKEDLKVEEPISNETQSFETVQPIKQTKSSFFSGLDVDDVASEEPIAHSYKPYKYDRKKGIKVRRVTEDIEYQQIISPIFGNTEESKKQFNKVHDAITLPKPEDDGEGYSKIISPMFGVDLPSRKNNGSIPQKKVVVEKKEDNSSFKNKLNNPKKD